MIELKSDITVRCNKCGKIFSVSRSTFTFEENCVDKGENGMGIETEHHSKVETVCENCGNKIEIEITAYEYPEGCIEDEIRSDISGAECVEEINIEAYVN